MLTWRELAATVWRLYRLSCRIVFHRKTMFLFAGIVVYYATLYGFAVWRPGEGFSVQQALYVLVEVPGAVLAIYLTMDMVAGERDKDTLEILFSASASHYGIWAVRLVAVCGLLLVTLMGMSTASYFFFAEFPFVLGGLNAFVSTFFIVGVTFYFSIACQSGNAAGMLALGVLILALLGGQALQNTPYLLFINPFEGPLGVDDSLWRERVFLNRTACLALGALLVFLALRRMEKRERLLQ